MVDKRTAFQVNLLCEAEKRAKLRVECAEDRLKLRLQQARKEAMKEIEEYRKVGDFIIVYHF